MELWDPATGKELRKVRTEGSWGIANVAFAPDGKQMVAATSSGTLVVWDVATGKEVRRLAGRRNLGTFLAWSPDGKTLAAGSPDGVVQTWDAATGQRLGLHDAPRNAMGRLGFTTAGKLLAWGSAGQSVYVWDVLAEKSLTPAGGHQTAVGALGFTPDDKGVVSASTDGVVCYWDAAGKEVKRVQLRSDEAMYMMGNVMHLFGMMFSPDGKYVIGTGGNGVSLFELNKGREVCALSSGFAGGGFVAPFSRDGGQVAAGAMDIQGRVAVVRLYDVGTGQELRKMEGTANSNLRAVAFAPDGKAVATASNQFQAVQTGEVRLWEASSGKSLWRVERQQQFIQGLAFAPDGKTLAALEQTGAVTLYDAADGHELRRLGAEGVNVNPTTIAFSPDGRVLAFPAHDFAGRKTRVRLYEVASGTLRHELTGHDGPVSALAFSADGKRLATGGNDTTVLLRDLTGRTDSDAPTGKPGAEELDKLWAELNDPDGRAGFKAMRRLQAAPEEAVALLTKNVKPAAGKGSGADAIAKLIATLDSDDFDTREKAQKELEGLGKAVEGPLKKALAGGPSAEAKQRMEQLLEKLKDKGGPPPELVRPLRAVEVLENLGTPEAKKLLGELAKGQAEAPLTVAAKEAVGRLERAAKP